MAKTRKNLGNWGRKEAEEYLIKKNFMILARNFRTAFGEIDIIAEKNGRTTFVEVKTRTNNRFGNPEDSVNKPKKTKLIEVCNGLYARTSRTWEIPGRLT